MTSTISGVILNLYHIFCVCPERIYHTLFRFVISQRDTLPSGSTFWLFYFAENCTLSENEHFASFSFFMPEHGKGGLFFNKEFEMQVKTYLEENLGADVTVSTYTARKNNQTLCQGLLIEDASDGERFSASPVIYLDDFYSDLCNGSSFEEIAKTIYKLYRNAKQTGDFKLKDLTNFEELKEKIIYKLINLDMNKDLLDDIPYIPYLDLAIVFYCCIANTDEQTAGFLIHNSHLDLWGIQQNELYKYAHKNTCRLFPYSLQSVCATLNEMSENLTAPLSVMPEEDLLVLTNQSRIDGAACILYDNMLEKIAEVLQEDFYVIPSSIHELLILRKHLSPEEGGLSELITSVNQTTVLDTDILSSHPYYYDRNLHTLKCA